ncbi:hypothetical protein BAUCODRAFT_28950 [Baudoinia panamericana UAMH 10762]|uniref:C4-dicarboxylate transporter/malic acid transport protein n=1 Tax=Baudoinia panamericana (strain UAMH 10762) TaxID=717646 RepID=M2MUK4_BAUPA|nr:uncharacterized protein BAUCODRAFT_28950 [Baudoinia panamericana UAMH 10762]EMD00607.1 hypothetical protein BAUCODRAFT_28950 [Baudoinia panamericana UAMH 10762]
MSSREAEQQNGYGSHRDTEGNGESDHREESGGATKPARGRVATIIENFSFLWFTVSMNTGILSILMHQLPWQFRGLAILSTIMFVFNIVLFTTFFIVLLLRITFFPKAIVESMSSNPTELTMTGAVPIAWFTIVSQVGLTVSTAPWGGHAFFLVAVVFWWVGTAVMVSIAITVIVMLSKTTITSTKDMSPALVIPFVGTTTDALVGGLITSYSAHINAPVAVPVIIVGYLLTGIGFFVSLMVYAAYFVRLMNHGLPPPPQTPSLLLLVGPCGQTSAALQALGNAASMNFGKYNRGVFLTSSAASVLSTIGTFFGLLSTGMALLFAFFAIYTIVETCLKRQMKYSMFWWGTIFPMATVNTAFIMFANEMDSAAFRGLSAALLIVLLVDYFINWGFTLRDIFLGKLLNGSRSDKPANGRAKAQ